MRHEYTPRKQVAQFVRDAFEFRRMNELDGADVVDPLRADIAMHANQRLMLVFKSAVRCHMHQAYFYGPVTACRIQPGGLEVNDRISFGIHVCKYRKEVGTRSDSNLL